MPVVTVASLEICDACIKPVASTCNIVACACKVSHEFVVFLFELGEALTKICEADSVLVALGQYPACCRPLCDGYLCDFAQGFVALVSELNKSFCGEEYKVVAVDIFGGDGEFATLVAMQVKLLSHLPSPPRSSASHELFHGLVHGLKQAGVGGAVGCSLQVQDGRADGVVSESSVLIE